MFPLFAVLFQIGSFFADLDLILKVTGLLLVMSFVRTHVQNAMLATLITIGLAGFLLFDGWGIFGTGLVVYLAVSFGAVGVLVDLFFFGGIQHHGPAQPEQHQPAMRQRTLSEHEQALMRARGINPEELMENMHEFEHAEEEHEPHEGAGHGSNGINSVEMRENLHKLKHAGQTLFHPPHARNHAHRGRGH